MTFALYGRQMMSCSLLLLGAGLAVSGYSIAAVTQAIHTPSAPSMHSLISPDPNFKHILPNDIDKLGFITDIAQDEDGFLWVAGIQGVARYDGYSLSFFNHNPKDAHSLASDNVRSFVVARDGVFWVVTHKGLCRFIPERDNFDCAKIKNSEQAQYFSSMFEDSDGNVWASTSLGIKIFNTENMQFSDAPEAIAKALPVVGVSEANHVNVFTEDKQGNLWFGTHGNGLFKYDPSINKIEHYNEQRHIGDTSLPNRISSLFLDSREVLWIGTAGGGLLMFDRQLNNLSSVLYSDSEKSDTVWSIFEDAKGFIWVGDGAGLHIYNRDTLKIRNFSYIEGATRSPGNFVVRDIFEDSAGDIWLGFFPSGLDRIDMLATQFNNLRHDPQNHNTLADGGVLSTLEDDAGNIWVGCGFGLSYFNRSNESFTNYSHVKDNPNSLSGSTILDMSLDQNNDLWLGVWDRGLNHMDVKSGVFKRYLPDPENPNSLYGREPWAVTVDRDNTLWVGTEKGITRYRKNSDDFERMMPLDASGVPLEVLATREIIQDSTGIIWFATFNGLYGFDKKSNTFVQHFSHNPIDSNSLSANRTLSVYEDDETNLWIGTRGFGLNFYNRKNGTFTRYDLESGMPDMTVTGIIQDNSGDIWVSTYQGLARFNSEENRFTIFDDRDGLSGNSFNRKSASHLATGELVFGSTRGLTIFKPEELRLNSHIPNVVFTEFSIFNKEVKFGEKSILSNSIGRTKKIVLNHDHSVFSFGFSALNFNSPEDNQYSYRLLGFEKDWNTASEKRSATYTNIDPGSYFFQVKASNNNGIWNNQPIEIKVVVKPPWWESYIAYLLYCLSFLFAVSLAFKIHHVKLKVERKRFIQERLLVKKMIEIDKIKDQINVNLDKKVAERTEDLKKEHEYLTMAQADLEDLNEKLMEANETDPLTGLKNRRFIYQTIDSNVKRLSEVNHSSRKIGSVDDDRKNTIAFDEKPTLHKNNKLSFILLDIDDFKSVNDRYGHKAGDTILIQLSQLLRSVTRESDDLIRWGGEEFIIIIHDLPRVEVLKAVERIGLSVSKHDFIVNDGVPLDVTVSIGVASYPFFPESPESLTWEQVLNVTDQALYCAKKSGRDCWVGIEVPPGNINADEFLQALERNDLASQVLDEKVVVSSSKNLNALVWDRN